MKAARDLGLLLALVLAATAVLPSVAETATSRVSYLAGGSIYVEAGRLDGLGEGDTLGVFRDGARIGLLRVAFLSSHRASCDTLRVVAPLRVGDEVRFVPRATTGTLAGSSALPLAVDSLDTAPSAATVPERRPPYAYRGRLGFRYFAQEGSSAAAMRQPALDLHFDGGSADGLLELAADVRSRRTWSTFSDGTTQTDGHARVYRLSLGIHDAADRFRVTVGRQNSVALASVSLFDGVLLSTLSPRWAAGVFGGAQPDPLYLSLSTYVTQYGLFTGVHSLPRAVNRWRLDLGGVTSYADGQPNRDFLFLQAAFMNPRLSVSGTQELDFNRGWKVAAGEPTWSATSTFLTARVQVARAVAIRAGFDNRRNVLLYRDHLTPETEFDDRHREGIWTGASVDASRHVRLDGDYRARLGDDASHTGTGGLELVRLGGLQGQLRCRYSVYRSDPTWSDLLALSAGLDPLPGWRLLFSGGTRSTTDRASGIEERVAWQSLDTDVALARRWYLNGSIEWNSGSLESTRRMYTGLSWSF